MAAWYAIVTDDAGLPPPLPIHLVHDVARLAALGAWRVTQSVYRFDPDLYRALTKTPISGVIPNVIYYLPEWSVYIETPGFQFTGHDLAGFFAHLEWDVNTTRHELRLLLDLDMPKGPMLMPVPIHLGGDLQDGLIRAECIARTEAVRQGMPAPARDLETLEPELAPLISLLLYLCSERPDVDGDWPPSRPKMKKTKQGWRTFPAEKPRRWEMGVRIGAALRSANSESRTESEKIDKPRQRPRPHIRRAHWHTYWTGSEKESNRRAVLKWVPPVPVAINDDDLPATIRPIR